MAEEELVIDESNFHKHFFDVRRNKPQKGQVMARYTAIAEFGPGPEKRQMIQLLTETDKAIPSTQVMRRLLFASDTDAIKVPLQMAQDLLTMTPEEVENKNYSFTMEMFFYTKPENIPQRDPHWSAIKMVNLDKFVEEYENGMVIESKIVQP